MLRVLEVVGTLQVLDVEARLRLRLARLRLLLHVVNAVLNVKSMLQLLAVLMLVRSRLQLERAAMLQQEVDLQNHSFHMTGSDLQNSHL